MKETILQLVRSHTLYCILLACLDYNSAMFHVYSGPLFANVQSWVALDLLVWGISPFIFLMMKPYLKQLLKCNAFHKRYKLRLAFIVMWTAFIWLSFAFMNYSQTFNWNYFSRIFNLDFGYFLFDSTCRTLQLMITHQIEQKKLSVKQNKVCCSGYCQVRNLFMLISYAVIAYLAVESNVNSKSSVNFVLSCVSLLACAVTTMIPIIYVILWVKNPQSSMYKPVSTNNPNFGLQDEIQEPTQSKKKPIKSQAESEENKNSVSPASTSVKVEKTNTPDQDNPSGQDQISSDGEQSSEIVNIRQKYDFKLFKIPKFKIIFYCLEMAMQINVSYYALWILQSFKDDEDGQFNQTVIVVAAFFMFASICYMSFGNLQYFQDKLKSKSKTGVRLLIIFMGIYLISIYTFFKGPTLFLFMGIGLIGIQQIFSINYSIQLQKGGVISEDTPIHVQIVVLLIIPSIFCLVNIGQDSVLVYALMSGICSLGAGILL